MARTFEVSQAEQDIISKPPLIKEGYTIPGQYVISLKPETVQQDTSLIEPRPIQEEKISENVNETAAGLAD